tara:strand:+ start:4234 stop:4491 length:258 start_codon:yes stop_codon:yes gene_type:complete
MPTGPTKRVCFPSQWYRKFNLNPYASIIGKSQLLVCGAAINTHLSNGGLSDLKDQPKNFKKKFDILDIENRYGNQKVRKLEIAKN